MDFGADAFAVGGIPVLALRPGHLDDPALDDVGRIELNEPVYHPGATDEPDLADGQGQKRALHPLVQLAAGHELGEAVTAPKLLLKLFFVESLPFEGPYLQRLGREGVLVLGDIGQTGNFDGVNGVLLQPQGVLQHIRLNFLNSPSVNRQMVSPSKLSTSTRQISGVSR